MCVGHGETLELVVSDDLIAPERAVLGSEYFCYDEMPRNLELLRANRDLLARVITHRFDVAQITDAFDIFLSGESGKVVVTQGVAAMTVAPLGTDEGGRYRCWPVGPAAHRAYSRATRTPSSALSSPAHRDRAEARAAAVAARAPIPL